MRDEELFLDAEAFRKQLRNCSYRDLVKIKTELEELFNLCEKVTIIVLYALFDFL